MKEECWKYIPEMRSSYFKGMKDWILDDWMPWHKTDSDYSYLDVNQQVPYFVYLSSSSLAFPHSNKPPVQNADLMLT